MQTKHGITSEQGYKLLKHVRELLSNYFGKNDSGFAIGSLDDEFNDNRGVFVTLNINNNLRGCIGFPEPVLPLKVAIERAALASALEDPRFPPVTKEELDDIKIEISVLTKPQLIARNNIIKQIKTGVDGLIVKKGNYSGLLLPQVAIEQKWNAKTFIEHTCLKAGLDKDDWKNKETDVYKFQAQIFKE